MNTLRVIQIGDCHLLADTNAVLYGAKPSESLDRVLTHIAALDEQPRLIIATGDISEDGSASSYRQFADKVASLPAPVYCLPGNHDDASLLAKLCEHKDETQHFWTAAEDWRFLFLNSQVPQHAHGLVGDEQLARLDNYLAAQRNKHVLVSLHHPSFAVCPASGCQLQNADQLHRLLSAHHCVRVVIAGHTHNDKSDQSRPYVQHTTPSSFAFAFHNPDPDCHASSDFWAGHRLDPERIGYRILDLQSDGSCDSHVVWIDEGKSE